ncbi:hypothetical protein Agub_g3418 [Astrephomene gubernaculifera]|uniref:Uncharacterized protein n=1 Tax=Astrephomene gubernaculifera TaxID=47775 RepID=A0AAD3DJ75_9CHLO|nr:hypothetical protein Agub_g3418 [Astrephomene gubernaculifera]
MKGDGSSGCDGSSAAAATGPESPKACFQLLFGWSPVSVGSIPSPCKLLDAGVEVPCHCLYTSAATECMQALCAANIWQVLLNTPARTETTACTGHGLSLRF